MVELLDKGSVISEVSLGLDESVVLPDSSVGPAVSLVYAEVKDGVTVVWVVLLDIDNDDSMVDVVSVSSEVACDELVDSMVTSDASCVVLDVAVSVVSAKLVETSVSPEVVVVDSDAADTVGLLESVDSDSVVGREVVDEYEDVESD